MTWRKSSEILLTSGGVPLIHESGRQRCVGDQCNDREFSHRRSPLLPERRYLSSAASLPDPNQDNQRPHNPPPQKQSLHQAHNTPHAPAHLPPSSYPLLDAP